MSDCGVCIGGWDGDPAIFQEVSERRARKSHKCCECGDVIPLGELYENVNSMWPDDKLPSTLKTCLPCRDIREGLSCGEGWVFGCLWEDIDEVLPELTMACINQVKSAAGRQKLLDYWRNWKFIADEVEYHRR